VLVQAHVARASVLVVATPDTVKVRKIVEIARMLNPRIETLIRTHSDEEAELLRRENWGHVFMTREVLGRFAARARAPQSSRAALEGSGST
jgi:monovalent cation:H+ antiporter-2, CPA2 family